MIKSDFADLFKVGQMLDVGRDGMEQKFYKNENLEGREWNTKIILKWILKEYDDSMWPELLWLRTRNICVLVWKT